MEIICRNFIDYTDGGGDHTGALWYAISDGKWTTDTSHEGLNYKLTLDQSYVGTLDTYNGQAPSFGFSGQTCTIEGMDVFMYSAFVLMWVLCFGMFVWIANQFLTPKK